MTMSKVSKETASLLTDLCVGMPVRFTAKAWLYYQDRPWMASILRKTGVVMCVYSEPMLVVDFGHGDTWTVPKAHLEAVIDDETP